MKFRRGVTAVFKITGQGEINARIRFTIKDKAGTKLVKMTQLDANGVKIRKMTLPKKDVHLIRPTG